MIKDTNQKLKAVRYCVALGLVPYMEVVVRYSGDTANVPTDITDVDVLGLQPAASSAARRIFFDCKTSQKLSAINRALWAGGLKNLIGADEGFVILGKSAPMGHRLAGNSMDIRLFSEKLFDSFALAASKDYAIESSYLERLEAWEALYSIKDQFPPLRDLIYFLCSEAPLETNSVTGIRALVSQVKRVEGELDPGRASHRALFMLLLSQALVFLSDMARTYHNIFDPEGREEEFEESLRYYVWGGRDAYDLRQRLSSALRTARGVEQAIPFEFPAWPQFLDVFRGFLDAPFTLSTACLPIKDLGFRELSTPSANVDARLARRLQANNRIRQYIMATASYLVGASRLPREFKDMLVERISSKEFVVLE